MPNVDGALRLGMYVTIAFETAGRERMTLVPRNAVQNIGDRSKLGVGQWLETDGTSRAQIEVTTIGDVEIDPNSRVRLLQTNSSEHRLELERGRLSAHISAPPKLFFVNTPSGVAEDLGCARQNLF